MVVSIRLPTTKQSTLNTNIPAARMSQELREPNHSVNDHEAGGSPGFIQSGTRATSMLCCNASAYQSGKGAEESLCCITIFYSEIKHDFSVFVTT